MKHEAEKMVNYGTFKLFQCICLNSIRHGCTGALMIAVKDFKVQFSSTCLRKLTREMISFFYIATFTFFAS